MYLVSYCPLLLIFQEILWRIAAGILTDFTAGFPVFVEAKTGLAWQAGQKEKVDMFSLIRLFIKNRKEENRVPNQSSQPSPRRG